MTEKFMQKVLREGIVDTKKYRYVRRDVTGLKNQWIEIRRLPIADLDTTAAIDGWETVLVIGEVE